MTNEEMEDERIANESWFNEDNGYRIMTSESTYNYAFKKGLKTGRPKWHEIKCCSQDLPPRMKDNYLHSVFVSNEYGEPIYYDYNIDEWCDMEGDVVSEGYKYWCELPKFKE